MRATLLAASMVTLIVAAAYLVVARELLRRRPVAGADARAMRAFALWWGALGVNLALVAPVYLLGSLDALPFVLQVTSSTLQRALLSISLVGLMGYMSYVLTGRARLPLLVGVYAAYFLMTLVSLAYQSPTDAKVLAWRTDLAYARESPVWSSLVSLFLVVGPPVVASIAYFRLFFRTDDRSQRYRIAVVASSLLLWWVVAVLAGQPALLDVGGIQLAARALSLVSAISVFGAFAPPLWLQRRFHVTPYGGAAGQ